MNKKIKKIWEKMDDEIQESIKVLINHLAQKKYQKLADEAMEFQGEDKLIKLVKKQGES
jgi:hypothetical protein